MQEIYYDLLFCSTFVVILLAVMGVKKRFGRVDRAALDKIIIGLSFFTGFSLLKFLAHQPAFGTIPILGDQLNRQFIEAAAIATGLIFLLIGIGSLLPSITRTRGMGRKLKKRYFCLKLISQTIERAENLENTFSSINGILSSYMGMSRCAAFKYSSRKDMLYLSGTSGFTEKRPAGLQKIDLCGSELKTALMKSRVVQDMGNVENFSMENRPGMVVPIINQNRLFGALFCWMGDDIDIDNDFVDLMATIGGMLGKHAQQLIEKSKTEYYRHQQEATIRLSELCRRASSVGDVMGEIFQIMKEITEAEYLSLAILDKSGENMIRYTIGSGGRLLLEKGISRPTCNSDIYRISQNGQSVLVSRVKNVLENVGEDGLFLSCGMRSKLAAPIRGTGAVLGIATLGHTTLGHFTRFHQRRLTALADIMASLIQKETVGRSLEVTEDQMLRLQLMERDLLENKSVRSFFDNACEMLTAKMNTTMARISLLDKTGSNLISQACRTIRETNQELNESSTIPLSLLPWHRMTVDAGKIMLINQADADSKMPPQELTSSMLPDINSAMLVPILLEGKVRGVISIGESRNWNRRSFAARDLIFAKDIASKCAVALRMKKLEIDLQKQSQMKSDMFAVNDDQWSEMRTRLNSSLASIFGAVELMQKNSETGETDYNYQRIIARSADRIKKLTDAYSDGKPLATVALKETAFDPESLNVLENEPEPIMG